MSMFCFSILVTPLLTEVPIGLWLPIEWAEDWIDKFTLVGVSNSIEGSDEALNHLESFSFFLLLSSFYLLSL